MRIVSLGLALVVALTLAGCGGNKDQQAGSSTSENTTTTQAAPVDSFQVPADLDQGPRADATPADEALAATGEKVFTARGCVACHAIGKKLIGPDLKGVASRRTERWMEAQILHPAEMTAQDPIAKDLLATFKTQMTKQGLTADEVKQVIEYLKKAGK